jgi:glucose/arabinose dehydrogenase
VTRFIRLLIGLLLLGLIAIGAWQGLLWLATRPSVALEPFASGFDEPVAMIEGEGRLWIAERTGLVKVVGESEPFLDLRSSIEAGYFEQGLLGLAIHDHRLYVDYTRRADGATVIEAYPLGGGPPSPILTIPQPANLHNGGQLAFGPDGYLYVGLGDGGDAGLSFGRGQSTDDLLGAILRIDVSGSEGYSVPPDNPLVGSSGQQPELWAIGLRNPWRFSFDRQTGDLYIGDVGYYEFEEVNRQPAGKGGLNFGWAVYEGTKCQQLVDEACDPNGKVMPLVAYEHGLEECAVIGGYVYRGSQHQSMVGQYFYGDYCSGRIWAFDAGEAEPQTRLVLDSGVHISAFAEDAAGELYVLSLEEGVIYRLGPEGNQ